MPFCKHWKDFCSSLARFVEGLVASGGSWFQVFAFGWDDGAGIGDCNRAYSGTVI